MPSTATTPHKTKQVFFTGTTSDASVDAASDHRQVSTAQDDTGDRTTPHLTTLVASSVSCSRPGSLLAQLKP